MVMCAGLERTQEVGSFEKSKGWGKFCSVDSIEQVISLMAHPLGFVTRYACWTGSRKKFTALSSVRIEAES
jgi:hypothetical protein